MVPLIYIYIYIYIFTFIYIYTYIHCICIWLWNKHVYTYTLRPRAEAVHWNQSFCQGFQNKSNNISKNRFNNQHTFKHSQINNNMNRDKHQPNKNRIIQIINTHTVYIPYTPNRGAGRRRHPAPYTGIYIYMCCILYACLMMLIIVLIYLFWSLILFIYYFIIFECVLTIWLIIWFLMCSAYHWFPWSASACSLIYFLPSYKSYMYMGPALLHAQAGPDHV